MAPRTRQSLQRFAVRLAPLLTATLMLCACAGGVRGESPFAQVTSWRIDGRALSVDLRLRNVNDEALELRSLVLAVDLDDDVNLFRHEQGLDLEIAAGGFETIQLDITASEAGTERLRRLSDGEVASLAYRLEGSVDSEDSGRLSIERDGHIYTVPGRPGSFR